MLWSNSRAQVTRSLAANREGTGLFSLELQMKEQLLTLTRRRLGEMTTLQKAVRSSAAARITQASILASGQKVARTWFDQVRPALEHITFHPNT